ncbi:hypothetical protein H4R18_003556 [Coemansia javaensis]|uniref:Band 7 domain-containing protein n=1 Tax=Coemansia javaensis TaxID=2761396 RepID=A0A9W8HBS7_9FUNG|nr:hypothetical protein H4R18_003556 [Coemansia javaensis]
MSQDAKPGYGALAEGAPSKTYAPPAPPSANNNSNTNSDGTPAYTPRLFAEEHPVSADTFYEKMINGLGSCCGAFGQFPFCFCFPNPYKEVKQGRVALVSRFGRYFKTADPGLVRVTPFSESVVWMDTRIQIADIDGLRVITKDNVSIGIEAVLYWYISNPRQAKYDVADVKQALIERTQTTLRAVLGGRDLQDLIENRGTIASAITAMIDRPAQAWGVSVESILIKDVVLSKELQQSLSSAATQKRVGQSKVIQAQAEVDAAILMREAADILNTPAAMQIRTLDSMVSMSRAANTKVLFVPVSQDNAVGSISAFGGPGATIGINAGDPAASADAKSGKRPAASIPVDQSVRDAALYSQLEAME